MAHVVRLALTEHQRLGLLRCIGGCVDTLQDIEEALHHASRVPEAERGVAWQRFVDTLLDKRTRLARTEVGARETRVVQFSEQR